MNNFQESVEGQQITICENQKIYSFRNFFKFFCFSSIGIFMIFMPININDKNSIPLDQLVMA